MTINQTYTTRDICTESLRECRVVGISRDPTSAEMDVAVKRLNMMLKSWQNLLYTIWKQTSGSITVTDATASYTITERPIRIDTVTRKDGNEVWLTRMTRQQFDELPDDDAAGATSSFYYHRLRDDAVLYVWPVPATASGTLEWSGVAEVEDITDPNDVIDVPSEFYEAIMYNLAKRLLGAFPKVSQERSQAIMLNAAESLALARGGDVEESYRFEVADF